MTSVQTLADLLASPARTCGPGNFFAVPEKRPLRVEGVPCFDAILLGDLDNLKCAPGP
jgi:hypothetical protein